MEAANLYVLGEKSMGNLLALPETAVYLDPTRFSSSFLMLANVVENNKRHAVMTSR